MGDLLWRDSSGNTAIWYMNGATIASTASLGNVSTNWTIVGDDNTGRIYWHDNAGNYAVWQISGGKLTASAGLGNVPLATWHLVGLGDFNGDGIVDLLWHDNSGNTAIWYLNSSMAFQGPHPRDYPDQLDHRTDGDYNGDGKADILWLDTSGNVALWLMNGGQVISSAGLGNVGTAWQVQSVNAE